MMFTVQNKQEFLDFSELETAINGPILHIYTDVVTVSGFYVLTLRHDRPVTEMYGRGDQTMS